MMVSANITRCNGTFDGLITTKSDNTTHRISFSPEEGIHCHQVVSGEDEDYDFEEDAKPRNTRVQARAMMDMPGSDGQVSKFRFLEYVVVADHKLYVDYFNSDAQLIKEYVALRVEGLNRIFDPLEIQIVLKHVEVFNVTDEIGDAPNLEEKLGQFKTYAKNKLHPMYKFDAAHLITGTQYAKMPSISSDSKACLPVSVSAIRFNDMDDSSGPSETHIMTRIMARELGSNLDLPLLNASRQCPCEHSQGCVMVDKTPGLFWTNCSKSKLTELTLDGDLDCLSSSPMDAMMVCGDGKVDKGEECDCLPSDLDCQKCCNLATCKLFANATCSSGSCCEGCSLIANGGKVCHQNASECALPVSCDGTSATCPIDLPFFALQTGRQSLLRGRP
ncbi:Zinc metalloproteinase-disintegrin-like MTP8 [Halotydeus destructor]|nr:Zinc metalloproteinase-disintegrin-like MTP8 [Halotydeus destructor]